MNPDSLLDRLLAALKLEVKKPPGQVNLVVLVLLIVLCLDMHGCEVVENVVSVIVLRDKAQLAHDPALLWVPVSVAVLCVGFVAIIYRPRRRK